MGHFQLLFNTKTFIFWQNQGQFILIIEYIDKSNYFWLRQELKKSQSSSINLSRAINLHLSKS